MNRIEYVDSPYSNILLKSNIRYKIYLQLYKKTGIHLTTPLGKAICVEPKAIRNFINGGFCKVHTIERLRKHSTYSIENIGKSIHQIDNIKNPNMPFNFDSVEGARIDTGIFNEGRVRNRGLEYHNKDIDVINILIRNYKKLTGGRPKIKMSLDRRNDTHCIYFPPIIAKRYVKIGISEIPKIKLKSGIPKNILKNEDLQRVWLRGTLSEDGCLYPFIKDQGKYGKYLYPRIQINRASLADISINPIIKDECKILSNFGITVNPGKYKKRKSIKGVVTRTHHIIIVKHSDFKIWENEIGFELSRHMKQFKLLMENFGENSKDKVRDALIKYNKLIPKNLHGRHRFNTLGD